MKNFLLKCSTLQLKKIFNQWNNETIEARNFSKENDKKTPRDDFGFVYTLMNEYSAFRSYSIIASIYIKKLEKNLQHHRK